MCVQLLGCFQYKEGSKLPKFSLEKDLFCIYILMFSSHTIFRQVSTDKYSATRYSSRLHFSNCFSPDNQLDLLSLTLATPTHTAATNVGCTERPLKVRFSEHLGSVTQPSQANTAKPVGVHLMSAGHTQADMVVQPIAKVRSKDRFILEARERFWIGKYKAVKTQSVEVIEHGLNLK